MLLRDTRLILAPSVLGVALLAAACAGSSDSPPLQIDVGRDGGTSVSHDSAVSPSHDASGGIPDASAGPADAANLIGDASSGFDSGVSTASRALTLSEVSILFPLPTSAADRGVLLAADVEGVGGPLVPRALYDRTVPLLTALMPDEAYARLRAVSARIDPCPQRITDQTCRPQLRLVFQPISGDGASTTTEDAALHAVYELPTEELGPLVAALRTLGDREPELRNGGGPLGVHPVMAREGLQGPYAYGLRSLILAAVGAGRLERLTFMQLSGRANVWIFGGFDRAGDGSYGVTRIAGVNGDTQRITHNVFTDDLDIAVIPGAVDDDDDFSLLYDSDVSRAAPVADRDAALSAALRVENPTRHDADSVDCARCHVAFVARRWTERVLGHDTSQNPDRFRSRYDLTAPEVITPPTSLRTFRAFGWLGREPAIAQRTVNETAVVLEELAP